MRQIPFSLGNGVHSAATILLEQILDIPVTPKGPAAVGLAIIAPHRLSKHLLLDQRPDGLFRFFMVFAQLQKEPDQGDECDISPQKSQSYK